MNNDDDDNVCDGEGECEGDRDNNRWELLKVLMI